MSRKTNKKFPAHQVRFVVNVVRDPDGWCVEVDPCNGEITRSWDVFRERTDAERAAHKLRAVVEFVSTRTIEALELL